MRTCSKCKKSKKLSEFRMKSKTKYHSYCTRCLYNYQMDRWSSRKLEAIAYLGGKCVHCGYDSHPAPFQFHHTRDKLYDWKGIRKVSSKKFFEELDKCILLCANCHFIVHSDQPYLSN